MTRSLLNEIGVVTGGSAPGGTGPSSTDQVDFSQAAILLAKLQHFQSSDPSELKSVLGDGATRLTQAASESADPAETATLKSIASAFNKAASTGDLAGIRSALFSDPVTSGTPQNLFSYL